MEKVFLLHHVREVDVESDDMKLIGIYSSEEKARQALEQVRQQPGFRDHPDGFELSEALLDHTEWAEGFLTL
jgi:hypothetical protein